MEKILIVSSSRKSKQILIDMVKESGNYQVLDVDSALQCREIIKKFNFDLIIISLPLKDDGGENLSDFLNKNTDSAIILIVKNDITKKLRRVEESGIYVLEKPLNKLMFIKIIQSHIIHRRRYNFLMEENKKLKNKIRDIKLIDRAKLTLIQYLDMSEEESHRYIEKQAMDRRITKVEVAKNILKIYEF